MAMRESHRDDLFTLARVALEATIRTEHDTEILRGPCSHYFARMTSGTAVSKQAVPT